MTIRVSNVGKCYPRYERPVDRLRHLILPAGAEATPERPFQGQLQVGVVHDDDGVLPPDLQRQGAVQGGQEPLQMLPGGTGTGKGGGVHAGMGGRGAERIAPRTTRMSRPLSTLGIVTATVLVLVAALLLVRHPVGWAEITLLPLALADLILMAAALALLFSVANVYLRDMSHFVELALLAAQPHNILLYRNLLRSHDCLHRQ